MNDEAREMIPSAERPPSPEKGKESAPEYGRERAPVAREEKNVEPVPPSPVVLPIPSPEAPVDPVVRSVEKILAEDLYEHFNAMSPDAQAKFRAKGEETVAKIMGLMAKSAVKAKEILSLIVNWLKLIPGVNKYFLEQESKIKTDKIMDLHKRQHPEN